MEVHMEVLEEVNMVRMAVDLMVVSHMVVMHLVVVAEVVGRNEDNDVLLLLMVEDMVVDFGDMDMLEDIDMEEDMDMVVDKVHKVLIF